MWLPDGEKKIEDTITRFDRIHERDGRTDGRTDGRSWLRGTVVERRSRTGELSLSSARPATDG